MNWATEVVLNICNDFLQDVVNVITGFVQNFYASAENMVQDKVIENAATAVSGVVILLTILVVSKNLFTTYVAQTDGDADADPLQMLVKAAQTLAVTGISAVMTDKFLSYSRHFTDFLTSNVKVDMDGFDVMLGALITMSPIGMLVSSIITIMIIIFLVRGAIRGAELCLMKILLPIFSIDLLTVSHERWNAFITSYLITLFGYSLQLLCFRVAITKMTSPSDFSALLIAVGFMYMAIKSPSWLEKFCYSSGLSRTATAGAQSLVYILPRFISK